MQKHLLVLWVMLLCILFTSCGHTHTWQSATCVSPQICTTCGETNADALGHDWVNATCTECKFCSRCGLESGSPVGHTWLSATCVKPETCSDCNKTQGSPLSHDWLPATCTKAKICSVCGETEGDALGHAINEWEITKDSTCTELGLEAGICTVCGEFCNQEIPMKDHTPGDWNVLVQPTPDEKGTRIKLCTVCETEVERESFTLSDEEIEVLYKQNCKSIAYNKLARTPGDYEGEYVKFSGYVVQVCSEASSALYYSTYRVATYGKYDNIVYIKVDNYGSGSRILENDYITFYGKFDGLFSYETVLGSTLTIPSIIVEYID